MNAQEEFDAKYITSSEICERLGVARSALVLAKKRGLLPKPITLNSTQLQFWRREDVLCYVDAWEINLKSYRGQLRK